MYPLFILVVSNVMVTPCQKKEYESESYLL